MKRSPNSQVGRIKIVKMLLYSKGHGQKDKIAAYRMGKDLHQPHIRQRADLQNIQRTQET